MIGRCVNGRARRQWLGDIDRPMRPAVRRLCRRLFRFGPAALFWLLAAFGLFCLVILAAVLPADESGDAAQPVSAPAKVHAHPVRRMT